jgi:hypothetical protein
MLFGIISIIIVVIIISSAIYAKKEGVSMLRFIYVFLLGIFLAFFVGLGVEAFYPSPKYPEPPRELDCANKEVGGNLTAEQQKIQDDYDQTTKDFEKERSLHGRNVSIIAIIVAVIYMVLSLTILTKWNIFSDGFLLGSFFTLIYSIVLGFESTDNKFRFLIVTVGLIIAMILGYIKFVRQKAENPTK